MLRRLLGLFMLVTGIIGVLFGILAAYTVSITFDTAVGQLDNVLLLTSDSLAAVEDTLVLVQNSLSDVEGAMGTVQQTTADLAKTLADTQPMVEDVSSIVTTDVPDAVEAINRALPNVAEAAGVIDSTLGTLSQFSIPILGRSLDLGIEYDPSVPFDQSIRDVGAGLEGLPETLRMLEGDLAVTADNLLAASDNMNAMSTDLATLTERVTEMGPLLDEYLRIVVSTGDLVLQLRGQLEAQLGTIKLIIIVALLLLATTQLAPVYLGWELVRGRLDGDDDEPDDDRNDAAADKDDSD